MQFDVVTIFPEMFEAISRYGITSRALKRGLWSLNFENPRDFVHDLHQTVDDRPFGGGPGMIMLAEPLAQCVEKARAGGNTGPVVSFTPTGRKLDEDLVMEFVTNQPGAILICGRYEGIDERFLNTFVDEQISLGDFVLSGGELAAMAFMDSIIRRIPGALKDLSTTDESFSTGLLDAPHYTRPEVWREQRVPEILLSGHHGNIQKWTREQSLAITSAKRPDLIKIARSRNLLTDKDEKFLKRLSEA